MIAVNHLSMCEALGSRDERVGGAVNKIILGRQAFGLLSEQGGGQKQLRGTERGTEGARGNTAAASKMASKGEDVCLK